jgi:Divergent InlB B-repeat domain
MTISSFTRALLSPVLLSCALAACGGGNDNSSAVQTLTVSVTGSGVVTSLPAGINCGSACSMRYPDATMVTLTAVPAASNTFASWGGACSGTAPTCSMSMSQARTVTAAFSAAPVNQTLSVTVTGNGRVTSLPAGIDCGSTCSASFLQGAAVTLTAAPTAGQSFSAWGGACSGASLTCSVTVSAASTVTAAFVLTPPTAFALAVTVNGSGTVSSQPAGISCGTTCTANFTAATSVTLTALPAAGQSLSAWSGDCSGAASTCVVPMDQARAVTTTFVPVVGQTNYSLTLTVAGNGTVVSNPAGINCGVTCTANFTAGTSVSLTATPAADQVFSNWSGACTGSQVSCTVALTQARAATAIFAASSANTWLPGQLLESNNDFNIGGSQVAVNSIGDAIVIWEQSDGLPSGATFKVFSRRYQVTVGWQPAVAVAGLTRSASNPSLITGGQLLLDEAGVATWIREDLETRRNTASAGWGAAFSAPNLRVSQKLTSAVIDTSGNILAMRSGSDVESNTLPVNGVWGLAWLRVDTAGSAISERAQLALSSNGTALSVWRESNPGDSNYSMKAAKYTTAEGWSAPESIETIVTDVSDANANVVIDAQGNGIAMWQQGNNPTIHYNLYRAASGWQGAVEVPTEAQALASANIQLAMTPDGRAVATWFIGGGLGSLRSMQYSSTTSWTAPVTVGGSNTGRRMLISSTGKAVMVYAAIDATTARWDLLTQSLSFGGVWSAATAIETADGSVANDSFVMNQNGKGVAIWVQNDAANSSARNSLWSAILN